MARFRDIKALQGFASAHAAIHNPFGHAAISTAETSSSKTDQPRSQNGVNSRLQNPGIAHFGDWFASV